MTVHTLTEYAMNSQITILHKTYIELQVLEKITQENRDNSPTKHK